jgi:hypothetical protein
MNGVKITIMFTKRSSAYLAILASLIALEFEPIIKLAAALVNSGKPMMERYS